MGMIVSPFALGSAGASLVGHAKWTTTVTAAGQTVSFASGAVAGAQAGDTAFLAIGDDLTGTYATPAGWTPVFNNSGFDGSSTAALFYKVLTSSDVSCSSAQSGGNCIPAAVLTVVRNCQYGSVQNSAADTYVAPTIASTKAVLVIGYGQDNDTTPIAVPAGYTTAANSVAFSVNTAANASCVAVGFRAITGGAVSPGSCSGMAGAGNMMRVTSVALKS